MNNNKYFSDSETGPKPRIEQEIQLGAWGGIVSIINRLIQNGSFGSAFPYNCPDPDVFAIVGTDEKMMGLAVEAEVPDLFRIEQQEYGWGENGKEVLKIKRGWPLKSTEKPSTLVILDLIYFCYLHVAKPTKRVRHSHYDHDHILKFDEDAGKTEFCQNINRVLARNGIAYELQPDGHIDRLGPPVLRELITSLVFQTGDPNLDGLLEDARSKFLSPKPDIRREAIDKLWDAWERLKSLEDSGDKRLSVGILLDKASSEPNFRDTLDKEAIELTNIGNQFYIRHSETNQTPIKNDEQVDYLFHRLFAMIFLLLRKRKS